MTHRSLIPGVFVLGFLLLALGIFFIAAGVPIVRMEIGWTEIVGGSVAASAGCVILAMGVLAGQLDAIRQSLAFATVEETAQDQAAAAEETLPDHTVADQLLPEQDQAEENAAVEAQGTFDLPDPAPIRSVHPLAPQRPAHAASTGAVRPEPLLPAALHPLADVADADAERDPVLVTPAPPPLDESAPALVHAEEEASHSPPVEPPDRVADPVADLPVVAAKPKSNFLSSFLSRRGIDVPRRQDTFGSPREPFEADLPTPSPHPLRTPVDLSSGWDEVERTEEEEDHRPADVLLEPEPSPATPEPLETAAEAAPAEFAAPIAPEATEPDPLQPVVVGRYDAGSASYVMYSNGMIEVETEQGTHQFGSMQELKSFIEKRDARVS